jgi:recombination protein RecA
MLSTGSLLLDHALGAGGISPGSMVEISGPDSSGKTSLCLSILAQAQKTGGDCAFIDAGNNLTPTYAQRCGINPERLWVCRPTDAEQALDILDLLTRSGGLTVIALDSITDLVWKAELHTPLNAAQSFVQATENSQKQLSHNLQRLANILPRFETTILFTNQVLPRHGAIYHQLFKNLERLALPLHAKIRLQLRPIEQIQCDRQVIGQKVGVKILRNAYQPCQQSLELDIIHTRGFTKTGEIFDLGNHFGLIEHHKRIYHFQNMRMGASRDEVQFFLEENPAVVEALESLIRQKLPDFAQMSGA